MSESPPHSLDQLAQAHAEGLSRRQVLSRLLAGAVAASPFGVVARAPVPAWAATPPRRRGTPCRSCTVAADGVSCAPCGTSGHHPTPRQLLALTRSDHAYRQLHAYAAAHHYKIRAPEVLYVREAGVRSVGAVERKLVGLRGARGSLVLLTDGSHGAHHPISVLVHTTGHPEAPTIAVTARAGGGLDITNPWNPDAVRVAAIRFAQDGAPLPAPAEPVAHAAGYTCQENCTIACNSIKAACDKGLAAAMVGCFKAGSPLLIAACAAAAAAACAYATDQQGCKDYLCGPICGCREGELLCPGTGGFVKCTPITANPNCGDCGVTCQSPLVCVGQTVDAPWSFHCGCPPTDCPSGVPDPTNGCRCACGENVGCGTSLGEMCCNDQCVNVQTDNANCGNCGIQCLPGTRCVNGQCCGEVCAPGVCCPPGTHCCIDVPSQNLYNCCPDAYGCCGAFHTCNTHC